MKRTEPQLVGDMLQRLMLDGDSRADYLRQQASYLWSEVVGPTVNRATARRVIEPDGTLHLYIDSGPLKEELAFMAPGFAERVNRALGQEVIKKVKIH